MEFPDDILRLIREFSRPRMQFIREYKEAMRKLEMDEWYTLKRRLFDKDAENVIKTLYSYIDLFLRTEQLESVFLFSVGKKRLYSEVTKTRNLRNAKDRELRVLLIGEKVSRYGR